LHKVAGGEVIGIGGKIVATEGTGCWRRWRLPSGATRTATDTSQDRIEHTAHRFEL